MSSDEEKGLVKEEPECEVALSMLPKKSDVTNLVPVSLSQPKKSPTSNSPMVMEIG